MPDGAINGAVPLIRPEELLARQAVGQKWQIVDVRSAADHARSHVDGAVHIPLTQLRGRIGALDPALPTVTYCNKGTSGNAAQNVLRNLGFARVYNLSGGNSNNQAFTRARIHPTPRHSPRQTSRAER